MQKSHRTNLLHLHADDRDAAPAVSAAVDAALAAAPAAPRLRVALDGDRLPAETISALIAGLRRLRERGGALEVVPGSREVRDALALTGLNRVFAFPLVPSEPCLLYTSDAADE